MNMIIVVTLALVAAASAGVKDAQIIRSEFVKDPQGGYEFGYESEDGSKRQEVGALKEVINEDKKPQQVVIVRGSYSYLNPEGVSETINYFADENGYHAEGNSVPKRK